MQWEVGRMVPGTQLEMVGLRDADEFRVLLVDDSDTDREIVARYLRKAWPFELEMVLDAAMDGEEALAKAQHNTYTLILLDWRMPCLTGGEVLRTLRHRRVRTPIVVLTSLPRHEIPLDLEPLGAVFLNKDDLSPSTLRHAISATSGLWHGGVVQTAGCRCLIGTKDCRVGPV
jgi:CheY-like chemotaxis protein